MSKLLIVAYDYYPHEGGKSTHIKYLIDGLNKIGVECDIVSLDCVNPLSIKIRKLFLQVCKLKGLDCYLYHRLQSGKKLFTAQIRKKMKQNDYDMVSAQDAISCSIIGKHFPGAKNVSLTMHTYFGLENSLDNGVLSDGNKYYQKMLDDELTSLKCAKSVIAVDDRIRIHVSDLIEKNPNYVSKVYCIKNFINTDSFFIHNGLMERDNKLHIICVRRLVEKNGVLFAVQAMCDVSDDVVLHVVGDGPETEKIKQCIEKHHLENKVVLHGSLVNEQVIKLYETCDAAIVPSITVNGLQEATSISALEAMAAGMPIIVSSIGGLRQLVEDGKTGLWSEEQNSHSIAEKMMWIVNNKKNAVEMGKAAREFVVANHSHITAASEYLNIFSGRKDRNRCNE